MRTAICALLFLLFACGACAHSNSSGKGDGSSAPIIITNIPDISLAPAIPSLLRGEVYRRVNLFNERIKEVASRHGLTVVDAYTATHEIISSHPEFFSDDGFHPSDEGYERWAEMMWPTVKSAIDES